MTDRSTLDYYERNAASLTGRYESARMEELWVLIRSTLVDRNPVLDIGCGTGRDLSYLSAYNHQVFGADGSQSLLLEARKCHPDLSGRLVRLELPGPLPLRTESIGGIISLAVLMHLERPAISTALQEIGRVLRSGGRAVFSVPSRRPNLSDEGRDSDGRLFVIEPPSWWRDHATGAGLKVLAEHGEEDGLGREGISWASFAVEK